MQIFSTDLHHFCHAATPVFPRTYTRTSTDLHFISTDLHFISTKLHSFATRLQLDPEVQVRRGGREGGLFGAKISTELHQRQGFGRNFHGTTPGESFPFPGKLPRNYTTFGALKCGAPNFRGP